MKLYPPFLPDDSPEAGTPSPCCSSGYVLCEVCGDKVVCGCSGNMCNPCYQSVCEDLERKADGYGSTVWADFKRDEQKDESVYGPRMGRCVGVGA